MRSAVICLAAVVAGLIALVSLKPYILPPLPDPPDLLVRKAHDLAVRFGYTNPSGDSAYSFGGIGPPIFERWAQQKETPEELRAQLIAGDPPVIGFWYRQSPRPLTAVSQDGIVTPRDPPSTVFDMVTVTLDPQGRMTAFQAQAAGSEAAATPARVMDWKTVFEAAGLDQSAWKPSQPEQIPTVGFDERNAWTGSYPKAPSIPMRIEAATFKGRLVAFTTRGPWELPPGPASLPTRANLAIGLTLVGFIVLLGAAVFLAWRNYSLGKGDARGSWRLAAFIFGCGLFAWFSSAHQAPGPFLFQGFLDGLGKPLYHMVIVWVFYMALEPYVRRRWPQSLISWTRVLNAGFHDPMIAGHVLFGLAVGIGMEVLWRAGVMIQSHYGGVVVDPNIQGPPLPSSLGGAMLVWSILGAVQFGIEVSCALLLLVFLLRALLRGAWLFTTGVVILAAFPIILVIALTGIPSVYGPQIAGSVFGSVLFLAGVLTLFRLGLLPAVVMFITSLVVALYTASDFSAWFAVPNLLLLMALLAAALWSFRNALGGRKVWKGDFLEG